MEIESQLRDNILEDQRQEEQDNTEQEEQNRPRRERRPPDRYGEWVYIAQDEDPNSYSDALSRQDAIKWMVAMEAEVKSLYSNNVWELTELPPGRMAIGSK